MEYEKPWYEDWFDSPYYHILYGDRDQAEAKLFMHNLIRTLQPGSSAHFLDLACGKGRHALEIAGMGFHTTGIDLSENSIAEAQKLESELLEFHVGDMRTVHFPEKFDYILNLFTSFGYFDDHQGQKDAINAVYQQLRPGGTFVIDYLNVLKAEKKIIDSHDTKQQIPFRDILFETKKRVSKCFITKEIRVIEGTHSSVFYEHVWRLKLPDFKELLEQGGFEIQTIWGDYELNHFNEETSDRLIISASRKA